MNEVDLNVQNSYFVVYVFIFTIIRLLLFKPTYTKNLLLKMLTNERTVILFSFIYMYFNGLVI